MTEQTANTTQTSQEETTSPKVLLEARDLYKSFWLEDNRIDVLKGMNLKVYEGDTISIVGASGAGKSTLLHILGTLDAPSEGDIIIAGQNIFDFTEDKLATFRNEMLGFVFQAHYLLPEFTAIENVMMPALIQRMERHKARERAKELLEWVGLGHRFEHRPGELSGGERQRVALCRSLVLRPRLLLADEPTGNLDHTTGDGIHSLLMTLNKEWGCTVIVVTHNLTLAEKTQRQLHLEGGILIEKTQEAQPAQKEYSSEESGDKTVDS